MDQVQKQSKEYMKNKLSQQIQNDLNLNQSPSSKNIRSPPKKEPKQNSKPILKMQLPPRTNTRLAAQ